MNTSTLTPIADLKPYEKDIHVNFQVLEQTTEKVINNRSNTAHKVATFKVADETGTIQLSIWDKDIDEIAIGNTYELNNGYVKVFQEQAQLTTGKNGKIKPCDVKFDELNLTNDISQQKTQKEKEKRSRRTERFQNKQFIEQKDDFSYKVNKEYLWAERR